MKTFEQAGEAMLLAQEGNVLLARAMLSTIKGWTASLKTWLSSMPTNLPPTEPLHR